MSGFDIFKSFPKDIARGVILTGVDAAVSASVIEAIQRGHADSLARLVRRFPDSLEFDVLDGGTMAVHVAAGEGGGIKVLDTLIRAGASVHSCNNFGRTPLHLAAADCADGAARVELLLDVGADPRATDILGHTALHAAAKAFNRDAITTLATKGGVDVDTQDSFEATALHLCASVSDGTAGGVAACAAEVASRLLELGANPALTDADKNTPLHRAAAVARPLEAGPGVLLADGPHLPPWALARNIHGMTPLEVAAEANNTAVVAALLRAGAGQRALRESARELKSSAEFWAAVRTAVRSRDSTVMDLFLAAGYDLVVDPYLMEATKEISPIAAWMVSKEPPSLHALCSWRIRGLLGPTNILAVDRLPVTAQCKRALVHYLPVLCPADRAEHLLGEPDL